MRSEEKELLDRLATAYKTVKEATSMVAYGHKLIPEFEMPLIQTLAKIEARVKLLRELVELTND